MAIKRLTDKTEFTYSKMRWREKDFERLDEAWEIFKKKVPKAERLPYLETKRSVKKYIYSRQDYNRTMSVLESVNKKGAFKEVVMSTNNENMRLKKWQQNALKKYNRVNQVRFHTELNKAYEESRKNAIVKTNIYGEKQIVQKLPDSRTTKLEGYVLRGSMYDNLSKSPDMYHFKEDIKVIMKRGSNKFDIDRDIVYKENYMKMFEGYENLDNYEEVTKMLKSIDPKDFYSVVQEIDEEGSKIFDFHYDNRMIQEEFNNYYLSLKMKAENLSQTLRKNVTSKNNLAISNLKSERNANFNQVLKDIINSK